MPESPRGRTGAIGASARYLSTPIVTLLPSIGGLIFSPCFSRDQRLGIEQVELRRTSLDEQEDHAPGRGAKCGARAASGPPAARARPLIIP